MKTPFWKRYFAWFLVAHSPRCNICGELMEVGELFHHFGTEFTCAKADDEDHKAYVLMSKRWADKANALQAEIEQDDAPLFCNYARRNYGPVSVELRRKFKT